MNPATDVERFEVKFRPAFKVKIAEAAQREGVTVGEMIVRAACRGIDFPEEQAVPARKLPGRKPKLAGGEAAGKPAGTGRQHRRETNR
jgi:hypothetical protein